MQIPPLIWSNVEYQEKPIWDRQKLVLIAEWTYFRVVLIMEFYFIWVAKTHINLCIHSQSDQGFCYLLPESFLIVE